MNNDDKQTNGGQAYRREEYEMTTADRMYLPGLLKGLRETIKHLFEKKQSCSTRPN